MELKLLKETLYCWQEIAMTRQLLMKVEQERANVGLELHIRGTKTRAAEELRNFNVDNKEIKRLKTLYISVQ